MLLRVRAEVHAQRAEPGARNHVVRADLERGERLPVVPDVRVVLGIRGERVESEDERREVREAAER